MTDIEEKQTLDFDWSEPNALGPAFLARLRKIQAEAPVFWSEHQHAWLVTRFQDCSDGLMDERFSNCRMHLLIDFDRSGRVYERYPNFGKAILGWIFNLDGISHQRLRTLLVPHFSKSQAMKHREFAKATMAQLLEDVEGRDSVDFIDEIALPFTCRTLLHMLGLPGVVTEEQLLGWGRAISDAFGTSFVNPDAVAPAEDAVIAITEVMLKEIGKRQARPTDDLLSRLLQVSEAGDRLTDEEIIALFHVLLLGGFDTTATTLGHILSALEPLPDCIDHIRAHPERMPEILDELQRNVAFIGAMTRMVANDMEWRGQALRKGDFVFFMLCAANWDESKFPNPEILNFERKRGGNLVFAPGLHHCLGHNLAKMELGAAIETIYGRYKRVEILNRPLQWTPNFLVRTLESLHVRFHR